MRLSAITFLAILGLFMVSACGGGDSDVRDSARESLDVQNRNVPLSDQPPTIPPAPPTNTPTNTSATAAAGVTHYICPNSCEGSGGATQTNCPVCGTQYIHNAAFHNQPQNAATNPSQPAATPPVTSKGPNAAGVWHYSCPQGCEGGADGAGTCANCGSTLAHNAAFHN